MGESVILWTSIFKSTVVKHLYLDLILNLNFYNNIDNTLSESIMSTEWFNINLTLFKNHIIKWDYTELI